MERALGDDNHHVRRAAVYSPHFGPQHLDKFLMDPSPSVRLAAKRKAAEFAETKSN
jgi:hypothetical protein